MNKYKAIYSLIAAMLFFTSCGRTNRLPISSSRPYEVMIIGDKDSILTKQLSKDAEGLPQAEPQFDVYNQKYLEGESRLSRAIVILDRNATTLAVSKNRYAEPQVIIRTNGKQEARMKQILNNFETNVRIAYLKRHHNKEFEDYIKNTFGIEMLIPAEMRSSKKAKDFLWISNNRAEAMQNIVICRGDVNGLLKKNLKGETDSMYVRLLPGGLWEMNGDAMGGPYRMRTQKLKAKESPVSAIAFVYAPEQKKRNLMRQTEAVLYTIKNNNNGRK